MWLLDTSTLALHSFMGDDLPPYAILSHTWGGEEVSLQDMVGDQKSANRSRHGAAGYVKIERCCAQALTDGYEYAWVDTCCIDKTNSSELSEAINSMFRWYQNAAECYTFLDDIESDSDLDRLGDSRWFTRGWTLQELIAPSNVVFFDRNWKKIGRRATLASTIERRTGIPSDVLVDYRQTLGHYSLAQTMSWASNRETTRAEDRAYSLLGLFNVSMPMLYGEGGDQAFLRLQLEVIKSSVDHSIFAWIGHGNASTLEGPFAKSPDNFSLCGDIVVDPLADTLPYEMTNLGLRIRLYMSGEFNQLGTPGRGRWANLNCLHRKDGSAVGIWLIGLYVANQYAPTKQLMRVESRNVRPSSNHQILALTEVYLSDPILRITASFGPPGQESQPKNDRFCRVFADAIIRSGYVLENVKHWTAVEQPVTEVSSSDGSCFFLKIPGIPAALSRPEELGILFFKDAVVGLKKFAIHLRLRADKFSWAVTGPVTTRGHEEHDTKDLGLRNRNWLVDIADFGEERIARDVFGDKLLSIIVHRVIISGKHGFDVRLDLKDKSSRGSGLSTLRTFFKNEPDKP